MNEEVKSTMPVEDLIVPIISMSLEGENQPTHTERSGVQENQNTLLVEMGNETVMG